MSRKESNSLVFLPHQLARCDYRTKNRRHTFWSIPKTHYHSTNSMGSPSYLYYDIARNAPSISLIHFPKDIGIILDQLFPIVKYPKPNNCIAQVFQAICFFFIAFSTVLVQVIVSININHYHFIFK